MTNEQQVGDHSDAYWCQKSCHQESKGPPRRDVRLTPIQAPDNLPMIQGGKQRHDYSERNQSRSNPVRPAVWGGCGLVHSRELSQEQSKPSDYEPKAHQGQTGSEPGQKRPLGSEANARIFGLRPGVSFVSGTSLPEFIR